MFLLEGDTLVQETRTGPQPLTGKICSSLKKREETTIDNVERHEPKKDRELGKDLERDIKWDVQNENSPSVN